MTHGPLFAPPSTRVHGECRRGWGYFDASRNGWVDQPGKLTPVGGTGGAAFAEPRPFDGVEFRNDHISRGEKITTAGAGNWRPDALLEDVRALRESDPAPHRQLNSRLRGAAATYKQALRARLPAGGTLPPGVAAPTDLEA